MFRATPPLVTGHAAPPFALPSHDGRVIRLVDFRGKQRVVLAFVPEDDARLKAFEPAMKRLADLKTQVLAVGPGATDAQARFAAKLALTFPLLSDPAGEVARPYGAKGWLPGFARKTFVIDGRGLLQMQLDGPPDLERIVTFLDGLRGDLG